MATMLEFRERTWTSADGRQTKLKDVTVGHLTAILNWVKVREASYPTSFYQSLIEEAAYRKLLLFADGQPYPVLNGEEWELVNPKTGVTYVEPPPQEYLDAIKTIPPH
jgi:hypothetical protein